MRYEVNKAFKMTEHKQFMDFLGRDPVTGNAYLSLAKMCLYNTDKLSSEALLKKIKTEREDVLFQLQIDQKKE